MQCSWPHPDDAFKIHLRGATVACFYSTDSHIYACHYAIPQSMLSVVWFTQQRQRSAKAGKHAVFAEAMMQVIDYALKGCHRSWCAVAAVETRHATDGLLTCQASIQSGVKAWMM